MSDRFKPSDEFRSRWESIIADADIQEVPFNFLKEISIKMNDGSTIDFNILELLEGISIDDVETKIKEFFDLYEEEIDSIDFHINVEEVAKVVDAKTKGLLGD